MGGTRIKIGILHDGHLAGTTIIDASPQMGLQSQLLHVKEEIVKLLHGTNTEKMDGIGIAFPGLVDTGKNCVIATTGKYEDAINIDLNEWAMQELGVPIRMENDARMACLGEWKFGAGKGCGDIVMCTLGTGFGSSAIIDGRLLRGKHYQAGVLGGHFIIDYKNNAQRCSCGNYGCVESFASGWIMKNKIDRHSIAANGKPWKGKAELSAIFDLSGNDDQLATQLRDDFLEAWGIGIVNLVHAYDPERIIIGGGISHARDILIPYFKKIIAERAWCAWGTPDICAAKFPDTAALYGATILFEKKYGENEKDV